MFNLKAHGLAHISIDCIKACPFDHELFALAYYQTNPDTQGAIAVARLTQPQHIANINPLPSPPLLHITWTASLANPANYLLVAASRTNDVLIYDYNPILASLSLLRTVTIGQNIFCLYLDIKTKEDHYELLVSSNESTVFELTLSPEFDILGRRIFSKHQYAVWTCRIDPNSNSFVCGDEVNAIYLYNEGKLIAKNSKAHSAGICDLTFGPNYALYTGGFDGVVTQLDTRKFDQCVYRYDWGGTIWRVIPNTTHDQLLLCNSSQKKFQIVNSTLEKELWNSGEGHQSLAYAADWGKDSLITASFYDKKICFWGKGE